MVDRELVTWFVGRGSSWSGTASELLAHLKNAANVSERTFPPNASLLCDHLEAHAVVLRSLGVDATVRRGPPRTVSLKRCPRETSAQENVQAPLQRPKAPSVPSQAVGAPLTPPVPKTTKSSAAKLAHSAADFDSHHDEQQTASELASAMREITQIAKRVHGRTDQGDSQSRIGRDDERKQTTAGEFIGTEPTPDRQSSGPVVEPSFATGEVSDAVFDNAGEALFSILDLRNQMKLHRHANTILSGVAKTAEQMANASGVVICLLRNDGQLCQSETGTVIQLLRGDSGVLAACARSGAISQIRDAESDPRLGAECARETIQSIILWPLTLKDGLSGAIAFCFKEKRSLHSADILTLQMFSDAVSAAISESDSEMTSEITSETDPERFLKRRTA
jgi:hypothetical protein